MTVRDGLWLSAVLCAALLGARARWPNATPPPEPPGEYQTLALNLRAQGVLGRGPAPSAFRAPLFPALIEAADPPAPAPSRLPALEALLGAVAALAAGWLGLVLHGPLAGLLAAAATALHPTLIEPHPTYMIEPVYGFLLALEAACAALWFLRPSPARAVAAGLAVSTTLLCRGVLAFLPPLMAGAFVLRRRERPGRAREAAFYLLACYLPLAPWVVRNAVQFGEFVPFERRAAYQNFFAGALGAVENQRGSSHEVEARRLDPGFPGGRDPLSAMLRLGLERIAASPLSYLASCGRRLRYILTLHGALFAAAAAGLALAWGGPGGAGLSALGLLSAYFVLVHLPLSLEPRYFRPLLPLLCVLAACGAAELARRARRAKSLAGPASPAASRAATRGLVLACAGALVPLYALATAAVGRELALALMPCRLPATPLSLLRCGRSLELRGRAEEALPRYRSALASVPAPAGPLRAELLLALGRLAEAAEADPDAAKAAAIALQDGGRHGEAAAILDALVLAHPRRADLRVDRGIARTLRGDEAGAQEDFLRAAELDPGDPRALFHQGLALEKRGRARQALSAYARAEKLIREPGRLNEWPYLDQALAGRFRALGSR